MDGIGFGGGMIFNSIIDQADPGSIALFFKQVGSMKAAAKNGEPDLAHLILGIVHGRRAVNNDLAPQVCFLLRKRLTNNLSVRANNFQSI